ncbi:MAG TPA: saccharopine dehydrogenase NADP-binding domain-containing protein, partial [Candidatus Acidoferrales bacterium]|nr:saccharopine dehydrogenase NADP-binding domain-containing protein [Candidatus Acidoferrales bacterium]
MRIFVLGAGATGSLLAQMLYHQGHEVSCGDRDAERARRFFSKKSEIPIAEVNARNLWGIVKAARRCQLLINASPAVYNEIILRAALRLKAHYLDMAAHLTRNPFRAEQLRYAKRFEAKNRAAVINAGVAPGLTNLLVRRAEEMLDEVETVHIRLFEETESDDPVSQWSPEVSFDEATSRPRIYRGGRFALARRFSERERFRFAQPVGEVPVYLAAQDEVGTLPHFIPMREMDVKIGGGEMEMLRRWYRQGKLSRSRGMARARFPATPTPRAMKRLVRHGRLSNARFAAAVLVRGVKGEQPTLVRWDVAVPSLFQIHREGLHGSPVAWATATMTALFVKYFPRDESGVFAPEQLPPEIRREVLAGARDRGIRMTLRTRTLKKNEELDDEEL